MAKEHTLVHCVSPVRPVRLPVKPVEVTFPEVVDPAAVDVAVGLSSPSSLSPPPLSSSSPPRPFAITRGKKAHVSKVESNTITSADVFQEFNGGRTEENQDGGRRTVGMGRR